MHGYVNTDATIVSHMHYHVPRWQDITKKSFLNPAISVNKTVQKGVRVSKTFCPVLIGAIKLKPQTLKRTYSFPK